MLPTLSSSASWTLLSIYLAMLLLALVRVARSPGLALAQRARAAAVVLLLPGIGIVWALLRWPRRRTAEEEAEIEAELAGGQARSWPARMRKLERDLRLVRNALLPRD